MPFTKKNYIWFAAGIALLLIGFWCMWQPPHDSFLSLTAAPVLLVIAYCIVFPYAIMAREKQAVQSSSARSE